MLIISQLKTPVCVFSRVLQPSTIQKCDSLFRTCSYILTENNENFKMNQNKLVEAPIPPDNDDCCNEGCLDCIWLKYIMEVKNHFKNDKEKLKEACNLIPPGDRREFIRLEIKKYIENN